jgi:hypothetical protein
MEMTLSGPTGVHELFPCTDFEHTVGSLAPGSYDLDLKLPATSIGNTDGPIQIGGGLVDLGPNFDFGPCGFEFACPGSVGCHDDGICSTVDDDCICADCHADPYCSNTLHCMDDGTCDAYYEGCSCVDCQGLPECA